MIPKKIHQIWLGSSEIPDSDVAMAASIKAHNPDWELVMHTEDVSRFDITHDPWDRVQVADVSLISQELDTLEARSGSFALAARADMLRIAILAAEGGVYLDTDVFSVKPFGDMFENVKLGIAAEFSNRCIGNFMLAAECGHPALYRYFQSVHRRMRDFMRSPKQWNPVGIVGPVPTAEVFASYQDCVIWPWIVFSPWSPEHKLPKRWDEVAWPSATVAVHAFGSKWVDVDKVVPVNVDDGMRLNWDLVGPPQKLGRCLSC